jgi:hypothetical protein
MDSDEHMDEQLFSLDEDFNKLFAAAADAGFKPHRPTHYYRDGTPILGDELMPAFLKWAMLFENEDRSVAQHTTPYGERLSTVFLGLDHNFFMQGPPILFETMLFAPGDRELARQLLLSPTSMTKGEREAAEAEEREKKRRFPHDQLLQVRYEKEGQARANHKKLRLQTLIPPRWRHFLLWTVGRDETWRIYNDEDEDQW